MFKEKIVARAFMLRHKDLPMPVKGFFDASRSICVPDYPC